MSEHFHSPHEPQADATNRALHESLTDAGRERERHLRESLLSRVDRTRRRRTVVQLASGAAVLALLAMLPLLARPAAPSTSSTTTAAAPTKPSTQHDSPATTHRLAPTPPNSFIRILATDQTVLDRLATRDALPSLVTYLTDDQLLASLHDAGFPAGLVSIDGNVRIVMN